MLETQILFQEYFPWIMLETHVCTFDLPLKILLKMSMEKVQGERRAEKGKYHTTVKKED